jgi:Ran-binding protein 1
MSTSTDHHEEEDVPAVEDEDTGAQVAPIVRLEEVAVSTGEEDEEVILDLYVISFSRTFDLNL